MESAQPELLERLQQAIALRATWLETTRMPLLKEMLGAYRSLFESIEGSLHKKGLLREDHYAYEGVAREVTVPPDSTLPQSGDDSEMGRRVAAYRRQLELLLERLPITLAAMDMAALKSISSLLTYVDWEGFGEKSYSPTTRALARMVALVRLGKDQLASRGIVESQAHITKLAREILERVAEIEAWNRESWKAVVRAKVLPHVSPLAPRTSEERTAKALLIKKAFEQVLPAGTWHPQLVQEILGEDQSPGSAERMEKLVSSLALPHAVAAKPDDVSRRRTSLAEAVRGLCGAAGEIGACEEVLVENERAVEKRRLGVFERIRRWFRRRAGKLDSRLYDIEYRPAPAAELKTESLDFLRFDSEMKELEAVLLEVMTPGGAGHRRVEAMDEEQLCDFLGWLIRQLRQLHGRMESLNALFHVKAVSGGGGTVRSIKLELLAIENGMIRAEAVRRENMACREAKS